VRSGKTFGTTGVASGIGLELGSMPTLADGLWLFPNERRVPVAGCTEAAGIGTSGAEIFTLEVQHELTLLVLRGEPQGAQLDFTAHGVE
jgi:hypothetical protein